LAPIGGASGRISILKWGSLDSFLVQDKFWQDKMGKPIANKDFMLALLTPWRAGLLPLLLS